MATTRAQLATYLAAYYAPLLTEAGIVATDTPGGLAEPLDDALLALGIPAGELAEAEIADDQARAARALGRYAVLDRVYNAVVNRVDVSMGDPNTSKSRSQFVRNLAIALEAARKDADALAPAATTWFRGRVGVDIYEPAPSGGSEWS